jgi:putative oxidoreductase
METDVSLQRLFSTFPDGWPGLGLALFRLGAGLSLIYCAFTGVTGAAGDWLSFGLCVVAALGGVLLLIGLWTPLAGIVVAIDELWRALSPNFSQPPDRWVHILLAVLAAGVAMLGPGAWSVDARLFGRKLYDIGDRTRRR